MKKMSESSKMNNYHGIIVDKSQKDKSILGKFRVIGKKRALACLVTLYKIEVPEGSIDEVCKAVMDNMAAHFFFIKQEYYAHFYRADELIIVFRDALFRVTTHPSSWTDAVKHGRMLGIRGKQLDFIPNRFEDEIY